mgnify:CR=1 FL=1
MRDFNEFDEERYQRKTSRKNYIIIALVFALIGGLAVYAVSPYITGQNGAKADQTQQNSNLPEQESVAAAVTDEDLPAIGSTKNLLINQDNPVVDIAAKVEKAVVGITSKSEVIIPDFFSNSQTTRDVEGYGSGIIISEDGYIVTNNHVVDGAKELYVILSGVEEPVKAKLIGRDPQSDVAVIKIDQPDLTVAKLGDSTKVRKGEFAIAIGNPLGHELAGTVNFGVISAVDRTLELEGKTLNLLQTDAAINQGNSGGALVNMNGEVIGMNTVKLGGESVEGLGFAIPSNVFKPIAQEIIKYGKVNYPEKPWLGVQINEITEGISKEYGYPVGILIVNVVENGPAAVAGIQPGDVITGFDNKDLKTYDELKAALEKYKVGDVVNVNLWRNGSDFVLKVKLGDMNEYEQTEDQ